MTLDTSRKQPSIRHLQHEMVVAAIVWAAFGALCVLAVSAWATGA